jgi:hypothetical protein
VCGGVLLINPGNAVEKLLFYHILSKNVKIRKYEIIALSVVLYGCETWSLTLKEEHRLRVFQNRLPKRIFGPKENEVTGGRRKLHNELHNLHSSPNIIRKIKVAMGRACSTREEGAYI